MEVLECLGRYIKIILLVDELLVEVSCAVLVFILDAEGASVDLPAPSLDGDRGSVS